MADDIDIEEHDVLDNPRIKSMFPDITSIKIEAPEDVNEILDYKGDNELIDNEIDTYRDSVSKANDVDSDSLPSVYQNKIVLGTKSCTPKQDYEPVPKLLRTSVVLDNWDNDLTTNPSYCKTCKILFPTENALDSHKMSAHSFLVAVGSNKAVKNTAKRSILNRLTFENTSVSGDSLCNHCNKVFPDEIALLKHTYELFPTKLEGGACNTVFDNKSDLKSHEVIHKVRCYVCDVCSCHFTNDKNYVTHVRIRHNIKHVKMVKIITDHKCMYCNAYFKSNKHYNGHIAYRHWELYYKKDSDGANKMKNGQSYKPMFQRLQHAYAKDSSDTTDEYVMPKIKSDVIRRAIPKSTLYRCNKCQIHFVFCSVALEHEKRCVLKRGDWKCKKCRRSFKQVDRISHLQQHKLTDRFKIIKVRDDILYRVLCKCTSCDICFDEKSLLKYHSNGCNSKNYMRCDTCHNNIDKNAIEYHNKMHKILGNDTFYNVDTVCVEQVETSNLKTLQENLKTDEVKSEKRGKKEKFYYYCTNCKCYMKVSKFPDRHNTGQCNKNLVKSLCKLCGLLFTQKGYMTHMQEHRKYSDFKLVDLTFRDTQTNQKIKPPFPVFKKCKKCHVSYFSDVALRNHVCGEVDAKICKHCGETFSDLAYKLHVPFHQYSDKFEGIRHDTDKMPELIKTYESLKTMWNILFLCDTCDIVTDSYDAIVEHGQDHFGNMESYNITINHCATCDLKFIGTSYEKHKKLHLANAISQDSFQILTCNYENLLSENWNNIFDSLSKSQVDQIVNRSKYKYIRCVRIETNRDGPINFTLYQCDVCKVMVDWNMVFDHTHNPQCTDAPKYNCTKCPLIFACKNSLVAHGYMHSTCSLTDKSMRILTFKSQEHTYINDSLRSKLNPESLKFIRCNICGKLINKSKYKKHVYNHKYIKAGTKPKLLARPKYKKKSQTHNFYKCRNCHICVLKAGNVSNHSCDAKSQSKQCPQCQLYFRSSQLRKHLHLHEKYKIKKSNINVINFKNGKIDKYQSTDGKLVLYMCEDCNSCIHSLVNIKRHACISENFQKKCELCHMKFHGAHIDIHMNMHRDKTFSKKDLRIVKFKDRQVIKEPPKLKDELKSSEFLKCINVRFFKCIKCKLLFITPSGLLMHKNDCENDSKGVKCGICGLVFHAKQIHIHEKRRNCAKGMAILGCVTTESPGHIYNEDKSIYRCTKCDICYQSFRAVYYHFTNDHANKIKNYTCDVCDITLTAFGYKEHSAMHAREVLTIADFMLFDVTECNLKTILTDLPDKKFDSKPADIPQEDRHLVNDDIKAEIANQSLRQAITPELGQSPKKINTPEPLERRKIKRKLPEDPILPKKNIKIDVEATDEKILVNTPRPSRKDKLAVFSCTICHLNFLHKESLATHLRRNSHDKEMVKCQLCELNFTPRSLKGHLKLHSMYPEYPNHVRIKTEPQVHEDLEITIERIEPRDPKSSTSFSYANKLYKCSACDVCFIYKEACTDHLSNHTTLDLTEYIACKICDLQFLCENIGTHMKNHREKSFSLDDLMMEEYQIVDGTLKVDCYSVADRLKSKAVSTTTHFESEESTVDSTVSVVSKTFVDKGNTGENDMSSTSIEANKT